MSQTLVGLGVAVNFGFAQTSTDHGGLTATGLTGFLLQKSSLKTAGDLEQVRTLQGDVSAENYYNAHYEAELTFVISSTGIGAAITATALSAAFTAGTIISITACASSPDLINTHWVVQFGAQIPQELTKSAELTLPLKRYPLITAAQTA